MLIDSLDPLVAALVLAALLVGATGTWSPCGFSMIETIGPTGHSGGLPTTLAASATFAPFAVVGAVATFAGLAWLGSLLHGAASTAAYVLAAVLALAAAIAEARGLRIVPQVRRQLPVGWRATMPMPLAAAGYGVLLGLGFTTFVLSYGVWALMGVSLAVGEPAVGLAIGLAFGVGRALPIVVLAPLADRPAGERACEAMAMRTGLLRGVRAADGAALALVAVALAGTAQANAAGARGAGEEAAAAFDPSAAGKSLAYERTDGTSVLRREDGSREQLPGHDPALGGPWAAVIEEGGISILGRNDLRRYGRIAADDADALAISRGWIAWRARRGERDLILAASIDDPAAHGPVRRVATTKTPAQLGRPALSGGTLVYAVAKQQQNRIDLARLGTEGGVKPRTIKASRLKALSNPAIQGKSIAYVESNADKQRVRLAGLSAGEGKTVFKRSTGSGTVWSLAIGEKRVYVTVIEGGDKPRIIRVNR